MKKRWLVDTDILVDYLRGHQAAAAFLEDAEAEFLVSTITVAELFAGCREGERPRLEGFLEAFEVMPVTREIAVLAGLMKNRHGKSHGTGLADALVAASAETANASLATLNLKHYPMLKNLSAPYRKG